MKNKKYIITLILFIIIALTTISYAENKSDLMTLKCICKNRKKIK